MLHNKWRRDADWLIAYMVRQKKGVMCARGVEGVNFRRE